jgi:hypothetical protein
MRALLSWTDFDPGHGWRIDAARDGDLLITTLLGPETAAPALFEEVLPSWVATTPPGTSVEVQLRVRHAAEPGQDIPRWTGFYRIAQWDSLPNTSSRRSFGEQRDADGHVATDTLVLSRPAGALQARLLLRADGTGHAELRALRLALSATADPARPEPIEPIELPIPLRSQMSYPDGWRLCSPTSVAMVLAYWHARTGDERLAPFAERAAVAEIVAPQVYDPVYDGHGNWGFNTAFAASYGLDAYLSRLGGLAELAAWLRAEVPMIITVGWKTGELANAPIASSAGHLLVVAGFDADGRAIVADPRAEREGEVRRLYDAAQLERLWQARTSGTAYVIHPPGWQVPGVGL